MFRMRLSPKEPRTGALRVPNRYAEGGWYLFEMRFSPEILSHRATIYLGTYNYCMGGGRLLLKTVVSPGILMTPQLQISNIFIKTSKE